MNILLITLLMFALMFAGLALGFQLSWLLGGIAVIFTIWLWGPHALGSIVSSMFGLMTTQTLVCVPLFIFMALVLERSRLADDLYYAMYHWFGRIRGGLAMGTVAICTLFAAMTGGGATAVPALGVIAVPSMFKRGYDKSLVMGSLMAGSALGVLIPPSIIMIIYTLFVEESIGALFMGGVFPGLMLSALFILYIGIRCGINPKLGPSVPPEETKSFKEKVVLLKGVILPILLVIAILGSIFTGIATPTEASAVGAFGAIICTAINRRLSWNVIKESSYRTFSMLAMVIWIIFGASAFAMVYQALGAKELIAGLITGLDVNRWVILIIMQVTFIILGCVLNNMAILMITAPIYLPIVQELEFNTLWFGILYVINMEMGLLTPPFGMTLFYMKAVVPDDVSMLDIYKSITPFVLIQALGLVIVMIFPQIALWLPGLMIRPGG